MSTVNLKDAEAGLPELVDKAETGEFITITRHGKPVASRPVARCGSVSGFQ